MGIGGFVHPYRGLLVGQFCARPVTLSTNLTLDQFRAICPFVPFVIGVYTPMSDENVSGSGSWSSEEPDRNRSWALYAGRLAAQVVWSVGRKGMMVYAQERSAPGTKPLRQRGYSPGGSALYSRI